MIFDVIIIGSGPGGSATAIQCANQGLKVVLIEAKAFPRSHPGETLHPGIEPLLKQLGVADSVLNAGFLRHKGNWVEWEGEPKFAAFGQKDSEVWFGFQAWRADFDHILLNQARSLGVQILQPCQASSLLMNDGIISVETSQGVIRASKLVDASGGNHWLARQLNLPINYHSPRLIAYYGYVQGECPKRDEAPAIIASPNGWTWTAKVKPQLYQWTRLTFDEHIEKNWLPPEFQDLKVEQKMRAKLETLPIFPILFVQKPQTYVLLPTLPSYLCVAKNQHLEQNQLHQAALKAVRYPDVMFHQDANGEMLLLRLIQLLSLDWHTELL